MLTQTLPPPQAKADIVYVLRNRVLAAVGTALILAGAFGFILLLPTIFFITFQRSEVVRAADLERQTQEESGIAKAAAHMLRANHLAEVFLAGGQKQSGVSAYIENIVRAIPPSVQLSEIRFQAKERSFTISGFAPTRTVFLELMYALEADPNLTGVSSPVANLVRETDVTFSITAALK